MGKTYVCRHCNAEYIERSEAEARAEAADLFPEATELVRVCEDCFIKIMDFHEPGEYRYVKYIKKH